MAVDATIAGGYQKRTSLRRVVVAATIGNVLEWFDFLVYGYFAVTIAEVFFPVKSPTKQSSGNDGITIALAQRSADPTECDEATPILADGVELSHAGMFARAPRISGATILAAGILERSDVRRVVLKSRVLA